MAQYATAFARYSKRAVVDAAAAAAGDDAPITTTTTTATATTLHSSNRPIAHIPISTASVSILIKAAAPDAPRDGPHPQNRPRNNEYHIVNWHYIYYMYLY